MERKYESVNKMERRPPGLLSMASESVMANLPIILCGLVVIVAAARELLLL